MVKPNDTVAIIIGLHVVVLALVAWLLFRFIRVFPADYSITSTSYGSSTPDNPLRPQPPFSPFAPPFGKARATYTEQVRHSGPGGRVNQGTPVAAGRGRGGPGPGRPVNVVNVEPA